VLVEPEPEPELELELAPEPVELAARWDVTTGTLQNMRNEGRGPAYVQPSPRKVFYFLTDIEAYEESVRMLKKPGLKATIKRAAGAIDVLSGKAKPEAKATLEKIRDELRALLA
jgi:hypothetical protein